MVGFHRRFGLCGVLGATATAIATLMSNALAQQSETITLEGAALEAVAWHPSLSQAAGTFNARGEDVNVARAAYSPQINAGVGMGYDNNLGANWRPRPQVGASQMLFDFGKTRATVDAAQADTRAGRAELLLATDLLLRETGLAVIELQRANALRVVAIAQLERVGQINRMVRARYELGAATKSDALQAQARLEAAQATLTQIEAEKRRWGSNLTYLTGRKAPPAASAAVPAWLGESCSRASPSMDEIPAVMIADALKERASADVRRSQAERKPTIAFGGDAATDLLSPFGTRSTYNFGLRVTTNVFNGGASRARARGASYAAGAADAAAERARTETGQRLSEAQQQVAGLGQLLATLGSREKNMEETGKLYRLQYLDMGTRTLVDLLNAEQELHQVRFDAANTVHDLRRLQMECLHYSGRTRQMFGLTGKTVRGVTL